MKKRYVKPTVEVFLYSPEKGFAHSIALENATHDRDYVLIEGNDRTTKRASDELSEFTDNEGEYTIGLWE